MLLIKAYEIFKEERYLDEAKNVSEVVWQRGLLKKGLGLCHGISGNGYVFLHLYRVTGEQKYLHRALQFSFFGMSDKCREEAWPQPSKPYSLFNGLCAAVCYLADLQSDVQKYCFPGCDLVSY